MTRAHAHKRTRARRGARRAGATHLEKGGGVAVKELLAVRALEHGLGARRAGQALNVGHAALLGAASLAAAHARPRAGRRPADGRRRDWGEKGGGRGGTLPGLTRHANNGARKK